MFLACTACALAPGLASAQDLVPPSLPQIEHTVPTPALSMPATGGQAPAESAAPAAPAPRPVRAAPAPARPRTPSPSPRSSAPRPAPTASTRVRSARRAAATVARARRHATAPPHPPVVAPQPARPEHLVPARQPTARPWAPGRLFSERAPSLLAAGVVLFAALALLGGSAVALRRGGDAGQFG